MNEVALTREQREFATKWHNLIYAFLNEKELSEEEYYDVVVFGFLRAIKRYFAEPDLLQYSFSTIAWQAMQQSLSAHCRAQNSKKRKAHTVSLHSVTYGYDYLPLLSASDRLMMQLETELLLHDLAQRATRQQMAVVQMKSAGYNVREIARTQSIPMKKVQELLSEIRDLLTVVCHE
ncbi:ECF-type sigma factor [Anaerotignum sp.]|uniref:ECF-type sigma factor n=1 Tax=Anaerotignum sp. TaxID=2039241 RepID=UPI0028AD934C|nr:ECF-type sigma factor [Anaerotignum sp.]